MNRKEVIRQILREKNSGPAHASGQAFAPCNIALIKYWGKRDENLNLPQTSSLSLTLPTKGAHVHIAYRQDTQHRIIINGVVISLQSQSEKALYAFIDCFRSGNVDASYEVSIQVNIPVAAGLASSSCIYAALIKALNDLHQWGWDKPMLSRLARLGSGSACRSLYSGFVEWQAGERADGMDSFAQPLSETWPDLRVGICLINASKKAVSSREGMRRTQQTSILYKAWPEKVEKDLAQLKSAIKQKDFSAFGTLAESNALAMHATMLSAWPPLSYTNPESLEVMHRIWGYRQQGVELYFTQDAGPNIKLLFLAENQQNLSTWFPRLEILCPFEENAIDERI